MEIRTTVPLHVHTEKSLLDSILRVDELVDFAKDNNLPAVACTEHGNMDSFVELVKACNKAKIKPIIGSEIYEVVGYDDESKKTRYHLVLLARNHKGFVNLSQIITRANEHLYRKPIITIDEIKENNWGEGLICLTACMAGRLFKGLKNGLDMTDYSNKLQNTFDYVFGEIQSHKNDEQKEMNLLIEKFCKSNNLPIVCTTDAHMLNKEDLFAHGIFIQVNQKDRDVGEIYNGCYLQTGQETLDILKGTVSKDTYIEAVKNTYKIVDLVEEYEIGLNNQNQMPVIKTPKGFDNNQSFFKSYVKESLKKKVEKYKLQWEDYKERMDKEIYVLEKKDYIDYFLLLDIILKEAKKRKIPIGPGRGSAGASICGWALDIHKLDSIKWDLDFSRFANLGREALAD